MKNLIYILVIILFFACSSKKMVHRSSTEQNTEQRNNITDTKASRLEAKKTVIGQSKSNVKIVIKTTNYDTTKPTDPATGKPPIISESTTTQEESENSNVNTVVDSVKKDESTHKDQGQANAQSKEDSKTVNQSKPTIKYYYYIIGLVVCITVGYLGYKNFSRIKVLFGI